MTGIWSEESKLARWLEVELAALDGWAESRQRFRRVMSPRSADGSAPRRPSASAKLERMTDHDTGRLRRRRG